jgi:MGT family glycosyltransferase
MARVLITTIPAEGHVRPVLPLAARLAEEGHDVLWYTGPKFQPLVTRTGARFIPVNMKSLGYDDPNVDVLHARVADLKPGINAMRKTVGDVLIAPVPEYLQDVTPIFDDFDPDIVVADHCFMASTVLAVKRGIPKVLISVSALIVSSVDTAPFGTALPPTSSRFGRLRNRALTWFAMNVLLRKIQGMARKVVNEMGIDEPPVLFSDWAAYFADRYLMTTIPELEYPRSDMPKSIQFVGPILSPQGATDWSAPAWWPDIAEARRAGRPVVVVTQGTASNKDLSFLLLPTISALADQDMLVIATTCGPDPAEVMPAAQRPANLRLEKFLPFTELLPLADLLVTNGGYGGVQTSLAAGVPLVVAGWSEDKMEVNARVAWSGVGLSLKTRRSPSIAKIRAAVHSVLSEDSYRARAGELKAIYAQYDGTSRAAEIVTELARGRQTAHPRLEAEDAHPSARGQLA